MKTPGRTLAVILLALVLAVLATFGFAVRAHRQFRAMRAQNEPIRAWMSVPFIAHAHHVPAAALFESIGVTPQQPRDRRSLGRIARETNRPVAELETEIQHAIDANQHPPGGPSK